jgi:hypothetical protein
MKSAQRVHTPGEGRGKEDPLLAALGVSRNRMANQGNLERLLTAATCVEKRSCLDKR